MLRLRPRAASRQTTRSCALDGDSGEPLDLRGVARYEDGAADLVEALGARARCYV